VYGAVCAVRDVVHGVVYVVAAVAESYQLMGEDELFQLLQLQMAVDVKQMGRYLEVPHLGRVRALACWRESAVEPDDA
jgi:hypothetical protein